MATALIKAEQWAPHPAAATVNTETEAGRRYETSSNGTRSSCGGWQFVIGGVIPGHRYRISWEGHWKHLAKVSDELVGHAYWGEIGTDTYAPGTQMIWDYVCAENSAGVSRFSAELVVPDEVNILTVRCTLRWTAHGSVTWSAPELIDLGPAVARPAVRVAVASGGLDVVRQRRAGVAECVELYAELAEKACAEEGARLVALPEICLQWNIPGHALDHAVSLPGPEIDRFADIAQRHGAVIVVGLLEAAADGVYNSAVVVDADGSTAGVYRKVHLASTETMSGVLPGEDFPVMDTRAGRVGSNICMDSSAAESARMIGLNGADFLVLPIMGDHRASIWQPGTPNLDEDRWRCIQRTRAMDNQLCMVVARNMSLGSCIIDRSGEVLAWNDGTQDVIAADVARDDGYRKWNGLCFRQVNWRQRRPHLYGAYGEAESEGLKRLRLEAF